MDMSWLKDGRKIPDDVMSYLRRMAVYAVRELGKGPEAVAEFYNFNRTCIYRWLKQYDQGGFEALESKMPPGAEPLIDKKIEDWLTATVLQSTPDKFGYDTNLWTCAILADLVKEQFKIEVCESTIRNHLKAANLSCQKPEYQDVALNINDVEKFLTQKFPLIQQLAQKMDADIAFEDEAGVGIMTRHGKTWGLRGKTPIVKVSMQRGGYNVLSTVEATGDMKYSIEDETINGKKYIEFLDKLIDKRVRPLILLVDHASFHKSKQVREYVKKNRKILRVFFLPKRAPAYNPDEQVWNEIKNNNIGRQPVRSKADLKNRLVDALESLRVNTNRVLSFFQLPRTKYASGIA